MKKADSLNKRISEEGWEISNTIKAEKTGKYSIKISELEDNNYQYRAVAIHPKIRIVGDIYSFSISK